MEKKGKKWFEEEIKYQVAEDGTYLQFSMNYHRVVVQLLTWAITLADRNGERFCDEVYKRAYQSVNFCINARMIRPVGYPIMVRMMELCFLNLMIAIIVIIVLNSMHYIICLLPNICMIGNMRIENGICASGKQTDRCIHQ